MQALTFLLVTLIAFDALAINSDQWQIEHIQIEDGLPDSTVYSIAQDQTGFMWFGTTNGLARFNGYTFKSLKHDGADPKSISNNNAGNIFIDSRNKLWIGTFGGGVNSLDLNTGELVRFPYSSSDIDSMVSENVQTFFEDRNGHIWIGTATGLYQLVGDKIKHFDLRTDKTEFSHSRIWDIVGNEQGDIWLGTSDGLIQLNPASGQFIQYKLPAEMTIDITSNQFRTLHFLDETLWIGSSSGLFSFNLNQTTFDHHSPNQKSIKINDIYQTPDNSLLIASMEGLYQYDPQKNIFKPDIDGQYWQPLSHVDVRSIYIDRSEIMWLATRDSGVYKVDLAGGFFQHHIKYLPESQLNEKVKQVWTVTADSSGVVYLGTSETLFKLYEDSLFERVITAGLDFIPGIIRDIETDDDAGVWIASSKGLYFLSRDKNMAELISTPFDLVGIEPADVFSVELANNGDIWLALYNLGVLRWNPSNNQAELIQKYAEGNLTDLNINHILEDSKGNIWIGSNLVGLFKFSASQKQLFLYNHDYNDQNSISSNRIKDIVEDSTGRLWVSTSRGLNQYNYSRDNFVHYMQEDGLINDTVNFILEDSKQNIWIGYKFGLSRFNPERNEINNYLLNAAIRNDGLITRSATIDDEDLIYLGSAYGYYTFDPKDHQSSSNYLPPLVLTSVKIDNRPLQVGNLEYPQKTYHLDHNNQLISFDFSVLDYKTPEQIQYLYRLSGLHEDWLDVSNTRHIDLKDLNPGEYQLAIKAINSDGRWQEQVMQLGVVVKPVWWDRGWVRALFVLLGLFLAFAFHIYRTNKIRYQNLRLEKEVNNRTIELQSLNEQLELAANSDFLTDLPNRMAFINQYEQHHKIHNATTDNSCIVLADVDHFKNINDKYGHSAGDEILVKLSRIMQELIRSEDSIARWGGEEFIFHFSGQDASATLSSIERIRKAIESTEFNYQGQIIPVTMTFGICQGKADMSLIECINAADDAMYQGKSNGRNRVVISPDS